MARDNARIDPARLFIPSPPCSCDICRAYCARPGWWTVAEAERAIDAGYAGRMMLELSPEFTFGVLSPAFCGNERNIALQCYAHRGCTFFVNDRCELFGTAYRPLECRYCHHSRRNAGERCHRAIEQDWCRQEGQRLVIHWCRLTGLFERYGLVISGEAHK